MSDTRGFKFKVNCNEKSKVTIFISKGTILSDGNLEKTNDNSSYIAECNQNIYWSPDDIDNNISSDEIISIEVQLNSENNQKKIIELKVNDDYEYYFYKIIN